MRPVVVFQNNELNHSDYPTTIIIPLSTSLVDDAPLRMRISKREDLQKDSDIVVTQIIASLKIIGSGTVRDFVSV